MLVYYDVVTQLNYDVHLAAVVLEGLGYPPGAKRTNDMIAKLNIIHTEKQRKEEPKAGAGKEPANDSPS